MLTFIFALFTPRYMFDSSNIGLIIWAADKEILFAVIPAATVSYITFSLFTVEKGGAAILISLFSGVLIYIFDIWLAEWSVRRAKSLIPPRIKARPISDWREL